MPESIFMKLGMYIMVPEPIWTAYFINPSHQSVCLYVYPPITRQQLSKQVPMTMNTRNNRRTVGHIVFCTVRVISKESLWVCLCTHNFSIYTAEAVVWRLPELSDSEIWSWVPWELEPRITVLGRAGSNLLD
jgi:hypothetical protein